MKNNDRVLQNVCYGGVDNLKLSELSDVMGNPMIDTIDQDISHLMTVLNDEAMVETIVYLNICRNSFSSGLYQLIYNGKELWYGTLSEINAIIKSMIVLKEQADYYTY